MFTPCFSENWHQNDANLLECQIVSPKTKETNGHSDKFCICVQQNNMFESRNKERNKPNSIESEACLFVMPFSSKQSFQLQ